MSKPVPLDLWIQRLLHGQHDAALREAVPPELLRLLEVAQPKQ